MTVQRVVVEVHLRVERNHTPVAGHHERIDLDEACVEICERLVHCRQQLDGRSDLFAFQAKTEGDLPA